MITADVPEPPKKPDTTPEVVATYCCRAYYAISRSALVPEFLRRASAELRSRNSWDVT
jgi:hypothetical protein